MDNEPIRLRSERAMRDSYDAFPAGDMATMARMPHPDCELEFPGGAAGDRPRAGRCAGRPAARLRAARRGGATRCAAGRGPVDPGALNAALQAAGSAEAGLFTAPFVPPHIKDIPMERRFTHGEAAGLPVHAEGRKATWFELFFDLVFVVAVARLSGVYAHHYDPVGAGLFALAFLAMWWCWLGHTFHATRFDEERPRQRLIGFLQVGATSLIGYGVAAPLGERAWAFGGGIAAFKLLLALAYLNERRWAGAAGLIRVYASLYAVQALLWLAGAGLDGTARWACWAMALGLDLASPWLVAKHTAAVPPHPEHLPERFGLFTIILLGEGMAAVVHALDHGEHLHTSSVVAAAIGALLSFGLWLAYFERVKGQGERHVADAGAGRRMRLWAYAHVPLYMGIASLAAGTVALAAPGALTAVSAAIYLGGLMLAALGLGLLSRSA